jgi:hypothetical protein
LQNKAELVCCSASTIEGEIEGEQYQLLGSVHPIYGVLHPVGMLLDASYESADS